MLRPMQVEDYENVHTLWKSIKGFSLRSIDDSYDGIKKFLLRNPDTSVVYEKDGRLTGTILCGHDGRRGYLYHVCVAEEVRMQGVGKAMVRYCTNALEKEGITKISLITFRRNMLGNTFWQKLGWAKRNDLNFYDFTLNNENITSINE